MSDLFSFHSAYWVVLWVCRSVFWVFLGGYEVSFRQGWSARCGCSWALCFASVGFLMRGERCRRVGARSREEGWDKTLPVRAVSELFWTVGRRNQVGRGLQGCCNRLFIFGSSLKVVEDRVWGQCLRVMFAYLFSFYFSFSHVLSSQLVVILVVFLKRWGLLGRQFWVVRVGR